MILLSHSILWVFPHQGICWEFAFSLIILLLKSLSRVLGRDENIEAHLPCICCKVKFRTSPERSIILLDQNSASVWNFWWNYTPLFDMISFSRFCFETWLSYPSMSLHVLIICFLNTCGTFMCHILFQHFFLFNTFLHSLAVS